jgi:hypothetical protein
LFIGFPADEVALRIKVVVDLAMDSDEFLQRLRPTEFEHRRLSSTKRLVGILSPIVLPTTNLPAFEVADFPHGRAVGAQPVGNDDLRTAIASHSLLEESQGAGPIPPLADKEFQHLALVIDRPPKIMELAVDLDQNLVDAPAAEIAKPHPLLADVSSEQRAKAVPPKPHRFMADVDAALMLQVLQIP